MVSGPAHQPDRKIWGAPRRPRLSNLNIVPEIGAETPIGWLHA